MSKTAPRAGREEGTDRMTRENIESLRALPDSAIDLADWEWREVEAHYLDLEGRTLDPGTVDE